jgi:hypothetical protein
MLVLIIAQIGEIVPSEVDHIVKSGAPKALTANFILFLDKYIPIMPFMFLSIPEGVSVATVIIDGVDVAPAGLVRRTSNSRERWSCPADIRIRAPGGS